MSEPSYQKRTADREKILATAKERFKKCEDHWAPLHKAYIEDIKFLSGDQWSEESKKQRGSRPTLVVDKLNQYRRQVTNDIRQNRPQSKVIAAADGSDDVAEAFTGLIRSIWSKSNGDEATDWAADCAVSGGFGFIRVLTEWESDGTLDQTIALRRVRNPLSVMVDPDYQNADGSDIRYAFVVDELPKEVFKAQFPNSKQTDWDSTKFGDGWGSKDVVRVCEYLYKVDEKRRMHLLEDGRVVSDEELDLAAQGTEPAPAVARTETRTFSNVRWCRMTGAEVLEERDWAGKYIPLVIVIGEERDLEGRVVLSSLIRAAKDAQRLHNYSRSAFAERVALTPKAPWLAAAGQVENYPEWQTANTGVHSVLRYDPIDVGGTQVSPPSRINPSDIPAGFAEDAQMSEHDIQAALGMYNASVGEKSNEKSGRAIMARQREGDTATFHFQDNLNRAVRFVGRIIVDLAPKIYDSRRMVRLLNEDGTSKVAVIDPEQQEAVSDEGSRKIYNLGAGTYDIEIVSGPSYTTKRQESAEAMMQMTQANPQAWMTHGDLIAKSQDWPGSEEFAKRSKAVMPPPLKMAIAQEEGDENPEVRQVAQAAQQAIAQKDQELQQMAQALDQATKEADALKMENQAAKISAQIEKRMADLAMAEKDWEVQASQVAPEPEKDASEFDAVKLSYEDKWKQLEADTKVLIAQIQSKTSLTTASMSPGEDEVDENGRVVKKPGVEVLVEAVNANLAHLLAVQQQANQGLMMTLSEGLNRPKTAKLSDGRIIQVG